MKKITLSAFALFTLFTISSCKKETDKVSDQLKKEVVQNYATVVYENYSDALLKAEQLKTSIDNFVASPSALTLEAAKQAWLAARNPYGQTEVYRFYGGPIDDDFGPEGLLNAWPMDEAFLDYVQGNATSGIINDVANYPTLSKSVIESLNETGGETNISCGFHAVEFLLWGQDLSASSAGARPYTDYLTVGGTAANAERRAEYLQICAELIVDHLQEMVDAWSPNSSSNYRSTFVGQNSDISLKYILQGMGFLSKGELAGERLEVAYDTQLQEDEHSCFSDNTHNDVLMNAQAIKNVYLGTYTKSNGSVVGTKGIYEILKVKKEDLAETLLTAVSQSVVTCSEIPAPFDQQILSSNVAGRAKVKAAIDALKAQGDLLSSAANELGLDITIE